jgi:hypothetical protein
MASEPTTEQRALYQEHSDLGADDEQASSLEEHLDQLRLAQQQGLSDEEVARCLGVQQDYVRSLMATLQG